MATEALFRKYRTPDEFAALSPEELGEEIKSCGLYRNKARNIIETSRKITGQYGGELPQEFEELIKLPGVGRKTANVVLSCAFGQPALAVDTHVHRVANRLGLAESKNPEKTEEQLRKKIPRSEWSSAHHWLIYHGRKYCRARRPLCEKCPLGEECPWRKRA